MTSISAVPNSSASKETMSESAGAARISQPLNEGKTDDGAEQNISYSAERIIGNGSFGVVFEAKVVETNEVVAIKKVLQDKRFKNRELQIMRQLVKDPHSNIVALRHCFYSQVNGCCYRNCLIIFSFCFSHSFDTTFREKNLMNYT